MTFTQYHTAIAIAKRESSLRGTNITFTGHSLGGGLATAAALTCGRSAVANNPGGVHGATVIGHGGDFRKAKELVTVVHVEGEVLTSAENTLFHGLGQIMPNSVGKHYGLPGKPGRSSFWLHGIDANFNGIEAAQQ